MNHAACLPNSCISESATKATPTAPPRCRDSVRPSPSLAHSSLSANAPRSLQAGTASPTPTDSHSYTNETRRAVKHALWSLHFSGRTVHAHTRLQQYLPLYTSKIDFDVLYLISHAQTTHGGCTSAQKPRARITPKRTDGHARSRAYRET